MPRLAVETYLPLWERALNQEIGIRFRVGGIPRTHFVTILYDARKKSGDPQLQQLILFQPAAPYDDEVWICKKEVRLDEAPDASTA